jgi:hypothetical protein
LIVGLAGLCTSIFVISILRNLLNPGSGTTGGVAVGQLAIPVVVGGPPIAIGVILILVGRRLWRSSSNKTDS